MYGPGIGQEATQGRGCARALLVVAVGVVVLLAGCVAVVGLLGDIDVTVGYSCRDADEAIIAAAARGDERSVAGELRAGVDPGMADEGETALTCAASAGQSEVVALLLDRGAEPSADALRTAVGARSTSLGFPAFQAAATDPARDEIIGLLLDRGADPDGGAAGPSPLLYAAWSGQPSVVDLLLAGGADPNLASDEAFTPILAAAVRGDRALVELLLARGASPTPAVRSGVTTPAEAAGQAGHAEIADLLAPDLEA